VLLTCCPTRKGIRNHCYKFMHEMRFYGVCHPDSRTVEFTVKSKSVTSAANLTVNRRRIPPVAAGVTE
jgi:hypothetical protein